MAILNIAIEVYRSFLQCSMYCGHHVNYLSPATSDTTFEFEMNEPKSMVVVLVLVQDHNTVVLWYAKFPHFDNKIAK